MHVFVHDNHVYHTYICKINVLFFYLHLLRREYFISVLYLQVEVIFGTVCNPSLCVKLRTPSQFKVLNALWWRIRLSFDLVLPLFYVSIKCPSLFKWNKRPPSLNFLFELFKLTNIEDPTEDIVINYLGTLLKRI